jgi:hypothetical protein
MIPSTRSSVSAAAVSSVAAVDRDLSTHPEFGDSALITARVLARYEFGLELFAERLPRIAHLVPAIAAWDAESRRELFRDTALQLALEMAFDRLESGTLGPPDPLEELLPRVVASFSARPARGFSESQLSATARLEPFGIWVGRFDTATADPLLATLQANFRRAFLDRGLRSQCKTPDEAILGKLERACALLGAVLPGVGASALGHIAGIGILEADKEEGVLLSASGGDPIPSTMVIAPAQLENPWDAAGHLLHEGLHLKLFDVARSHALLADPDVEVDIPWRAVPFSLVRALFSFHVYVHMVFFKAAVDWTGPAFYARFGDPWAYTTRMQAMSVAKNRADDQFGRSLDRARHIGARLQGPWAGHLTEEGRGLVRWLIDCVERLVPELNPSRRPAEGQGHAARA